MSTLIDVARVVGLAVIAIALTIVVYWFAAECELLRAESDERQPTRSRIEPIGKRRP
jgi:hypothetical protein